MKKYTKRGSFLRFIQRRARRSLEARKRFESYRRQKNRMENRLNLQDKHALRKKRQFVPPGYKYVKAPENFQFVTNPEEVSEFISVLKVLRNARHPVFVELKRVKNIDYDAITLLLSAVVGFQSKRIAFNGDFPADPLVKQMIEDSGFFKYISDYKFKDQDHYELSATKIYTHAKKNVDSVLGMKVIESASRTVWGEVRRCPGVQRVLIELMQNTNNHASNEGVGEKHWWLSVKHIKDQNKVAFSFLDYGVGVFQSLRGKKPNEKFFGAVDRLKDIMLKQITNGNDPHILKLIFEGELHRTTTGKTYRGKGLPGIFQALQRNQISNLAMITNGVVYKSSDNSFSMLANQFSGTFVSFELNRTNTTLN
jgi:hypothetical protein